MTTPNTDLAEQIARALYDSDQEPGEPRGGIHPGYFEYAAAVLPLVDAAVKRGQAEALRDAAKGLDLDAIAEEWSDRPGPRDDMHWAAGNAASAVQIAILNAADLIEKEAPDEQ